MWLGSHNLIRAGDFASVRSLSCSLLVGPVCCLLCLVMLKPARIVGRAFPISTHQAGTRADAAHAPRNPAQLYRAHCIECHDSDGQGAVARESMPRIPDLTDREWQDAKHDQELTDSILKGKGRMMPAMEDKLTTADLPGIVALIRGFRGGGMVVPEEEKGNQSRDRITTQTPILPSPPSHPAEKGRSVSRRGLEHRGLERALGLYRKFCATCHDANGQGRALRDTMPEIPDFTDRVWLARTKQSALISSILDGKGVSMPAFRGKLGGADAELLASYLKSFGSHTEPATNSPDDFDRRFQMLQDELDDLRRRSRALSPPAESHPDAIPEGAECPH